jgi:pyrrolidone-carboxylate peptidase
MSTNPSSEIMKGLPTSMLLPATSKSAKIRINLVLRPNIPVAWSYVHRNIPNLLDEVQPDLVLHIGLYSRRPSLWSIEYSAPLHGFNSPDVNGDLWRSLGAQVPAILA